MGGKKTPFNISGKGPKGKQQGIKKIHKNSAKSRQSVKSEPRPAQGGRVSTTNFCSQEQQTPWPQLPAQGLSAFLTQPSATCGCQALGKCSGEVRAPFFHLRLMSGIEALPQTLLRILRPQQPMPQLVRPGETSQENLKLVNLPLLPK